MDRRSFLIALGLAAAPLAAVGQTMDMTNMDMTNMDMTEADPSHSHAAVPVDPDLPIPSVTMLVFPDAMDGYNVQILTQNFEFTPAAINTDVVPNQGHAHIYINGQKIARVYGHWYHLPSALFTQEVSAVTVSLNANDHGTWALPDGSLIISTVPVIRRAQ